MKNDSVITSWRDLKHEKRKKWDCCLFNFDSEMYLFGANGKYQEETKICAVIFVGYILFYKLILYACDSNMSKII